MFGSESAVCAGEFILQRLDVLRQAEPDQRGVNLEYRHCKQQQAAYVYIKSCRARPPVSQQNPQSGDKGTGENPNPRHYYIYGHFNIKLEQVEANSLQIMHNRASPARQEPAQGGPVLCEAVRWGTFGRAHSNIVSSRQYVKYGMQWISLTFPSLPFSTPPASGRN
ncbi:MAG: hypothetical protein WA265_19755 [Rhodomicrobium sp.]